MQCRNCDFVVTCQTDIWHTQRASETDAVTGAHSEQCKVEQACQSETEDRSALRPHQSLATRQN